MIFRVMALKSSRSFALVIICCILLISTLIFSQEPQKRVLRYEKSFQILGPHKDSSNQTPERKNKEGLGTLNTSIKHRMSKFQGQKFKSTKFHQAASARNNPDDDDFWNMNHEERSRVCMHLIVGWVSAQCSLL